ncbi:Oidioi.mRNA.OKI2018_I69.XSR.g14437.t1.cds [Oikopleura dioica]|uniref:Phospholipid scramblase n=1 Tax=Oikopleura dioica TaxID=34765 RepID=A0ABN7S9S7_OIKDI|nr:Oidioi.mRNA.OKI2018_I69.XSR.g14437.t1.cds [Oikopleura dioica]
MSKPVITIQPNENGWKDYKMKGEGEDGGDSKSEYLDGVEQAVVQQDLSLVEFMTGYDVINKYRIWDGKTGETLFQATEGDIGCCARNCFQGEREFEMPLRTKEDKDGDMHRLSKPRAIALQPCCNTCCCNFWHRIFCCGCCGFDFSKPLANLSTFFNDKKTHWILQKDGGNCGRANFVITDEVNKKIIYEIKRPELCVCAWDCGDVVYPILDPEGQQVGSITKYWAGGKKGCSGCCIEGANASTHVIDFPSTASHTEKLALIGQTLLIDYTYYQKKNNNNGGS